MARQKLLTKRMWKKLEPLIPKPPQGKSGGRPWVENRRCLEGILWLCKTGARWCDLPEEYPSPSTCWRRMRQWEEEGIWVKIWQTLLGELDANGRLKWEETFADGSFAPAKKGAMESGRPSGARVRSGWWWSMAKGFHWGDGLFRLTQPRTRSSKPRWKRSGCRGKEGAGRKRSRSE